MTRWLVPGIDIPVSGSFELNDVIYPDGWLEAPEAAEELGAIPEPDHDRSTQVAEIVDGKWVVRNKTPEEMSFSVPSEVFMTDFLEALVNGGWITPAEYYEWARGTSLPPSVDAAIDAAVVAGTLTEDQAIMNRGRLLRASLVVRNHQSMKLFVDAGIMTSAQLDDVFRIAGGLT